MGIFVKNSSQLSVGYHTVGDSKYNTFYLVHSVDIKDIWLSQSAMSCNLHKKILKLAVSIVQEGGGSLTHFSCAISCSVHSGHMTIGCFAFLALSSFSFNDPTTLGATDCL